MNPRNFGIVLIQRVAREEIVVERTREKEKTIISGESLDSHCPIEVHRLATESLRASKIVGHKAEGEEQVQASLPPVTKPSAHRDESTS
jgi:hypothetical protein